jgi:hypothetical protein
LIERTETNATGEFRDPHPGPLPSDGRGRNTRLFVVVLERQQQAAAGRRILAGKVIKFLLKVLEAEIGFERAGIFEEQFADRGQELG